MFFLDLFQEGTKLIPIHYLMYGNNQPCLKMYINNSGRNWFHFMARNTKMAEVAQPNITHALISNTRHEDFQEDFKRQRSWKYLFTKLSHTNPEQYWIKVSEFHMLLFSTINYQVESNCMLFNKKVKSQSTLPPMDLCSFQEAHLSFIWNAAEVNMATCFDNIRSIVKTLQLCISNCLSTQLLELCLWVT